jgi:hypothetical protein
MDYRESRLHLTKVKQNGITILSATDGFNRATEQDMLGTQLTMKLRFGP